MTTMEPATFQEHDEEEPLCKSPSQEEAKQQSRYQRLLGASLVSVCTVVLILLLCVQPDVHVTEEVVDSLAFNISAHADQVALAFSPRHDGYDWCTDDIARLHEGLLFIKVPKCGSSTGAGINERVAETLGRRVRSSGTPCIHHNSHGSAKRNFGQGRRDETKSFLWTIIRKPDTRALSNFFFSEVARYGQKATEKNILKSFKKHRRNFLLLYLTIGDRPHQYNVTSVAKVLRQYDFIALVERMPESIVVFSMLAQIPLPDVIVMASKKGGYDDGRSSAGCVQVPHKWTTPKIDAWIQNNFTRYHYWDYVLHQAVNKSLDLTIQALGKDKVDQKLADYHAMMQRNDELCADQAVFPCPVDRPNHAALTAASCYEGDWACGHKCTEYIFKDESDLEWQSILALSDNKP